MQEKSKCWCCEKNDVTDRSDSVRTVFGVRVCLVCSKDLQAKIPKLSYAKEDARMKRWEKANPLHSFAKSVAVEFVK